MKQTNPSQTPFWKRLFGTTAKKKQESTEKQTSSSTWQKLKEKADPNNMYFRNPDPL